MTSKNSNTFSPEVRERAAEAAIEAFNEAFCMRLPGAMTRQATRVHWVQPGRQ